MFEAPECEAPLLIAPTPPALRVPVAELPVTHRQAGVAVIGAGVVGLACAYYLAREGADVLVIDRDEAGLAASTANAGSLHVQILSYDYGYPGMPEDGGPAAHTMLIAPRSIDLWKQIAAEAGESLGISTQGGFVLADTAAALRWLEAKIAMEKRWGIETHLIGANELRTLAPTLSPDLLGGVFCPLEGRIDPLRGTLALSRLASKRGARLLRGAEVVSITREGTGWRVRTTRGTVGAGQVVNCAGAWGARIGDMVGLDLPVTGTVQQVIVTEPAPKLVGHLMALAQRHLSLKQQDSGGLLVGGGWFGHYDPADGRSRTLRRNIQGNLWVAVRVLPALRGLSVVRSWTGINPQVDRAPLLGEAPGLPGFFNAITANGYTLGPVAGQITAAAVLGREAPDPRYTLQRFNAAAARPPLLRPA
jgi:glycine/D-amino acid oxidase-like deaminating enzyme